MPVKLKPVIGGVLIAAVIAAVVWVTVWGTRTDPAGPSEPEPEPTVVTGAPPALAPQPAPEQVAPADDGAAAIAELYETERTDVQVRGEGVVARTLSDDVEGDRHQRFILELSNGLTVLVAHNIDDFPRLDGLQAGDRVAFYGEYVWSEQGGTIHWTHRDNQGDHPDGWLEWNGRRYW